MGSQTTSIQQRLYRKLSERLAARTVVRSNGCWEWTGTVIPKGYGQISVAGSHTYVHRLAWMLANGPDIPEGRHVCHRCDNKLCVNPAHLFVGTNAENRADSVAKGRHSHGTTHQWAKLDEATVLAIREARRGGLTVKELAEKFDVPYKTIDKVVYRASWKHLP